ncbi:MAG: SNF2-related protein [Collinsella intestinalis]
MIPDFFDNRSKILKDDLVAHVQAGDKMSVAASVFSMYAYRELREQLNNLDEFRFIYTSPAFLNEHGKKEQREFYIPRLDRERGVGGTDLEIRLRNELTQKAIATECAQWIREKATFKSFKGAAGLPPSLTVEMTPSAESAETDVASYIPFNGFTTVELGAARSADAYGVICRQDGTSSRMLLNTFEQAWNSGDLDDVTDAVVDNISQMYRENPPELVYYAALYRIFHEFLDDITADELPKEGTGFRESKIWNLLYDFQRDAVLAIINKLQTYDGCILADSVGLGKTFTALAVVKYYESLNRNVLVLCPKKLGDNWLTYRNNQRHNPIAADRLRYDVLYHTDLSRQRGTSATGLDLETINWGAYDPVVIDESHNFRNGADSSRAARDGEEGE